jgi:hypothetical protein
MNELAVQDIPTGVQDGSEGERQRAGIADLKKQRLRIMRSPFNTRKVALIGRQVADLPVK